MADGNEQVIVAAPAKNSKRMLLIVLVLALCGAGACAVLMVKEKRAPVQTPPEPQIKSVIHLDTFVVNIGGPEENGYLRVGVDLGCAGEANEGEGKGSPTPTALVRDTILAVLTTTKADDLITPEGKTKLKESITQALRVRAPKLEVHEVYFTEFLLQR